MFLLGVCLESLPVYLPDATFLSLYPFFPGST